MEAEVIVHSDFSASDRDFDSQLCVLDGEPVLSEDCEREHLHAKDSSQQASPSLSLTKVSRDQENKSDPEAHSVLLRIDGQAHKMAAEFLETDTGFPRPGQSLDSAESGDSDSLPEGGEDAQANLRKAFPTGQSQPLLCSSLSSIINSPSVFESVACVHHL